MQNHHLNPRAEIFVPAPAARVYHGRYPDAAPKISVTQELLDNLPRMSPSQDLNPGVLGAASAAVMSVTDELLGLQHEQSGDHWLDHTPEYEDDWPVQPGRMGFGGGHEEGSKLGMHDECGWSDPEVDDSLGESDRAGTGFGEGPNQNNWPNPLENVSIVRGGPTLVASTPLDGKRGRPEHRESPIRKRGPRLTARTGALCLVGETGGEGEI